MNGLGACSLGRLDKSLDDEVALGGGRRSNEVRLVGHARVQRSTIGFGVDGHRADSKLTERAKDANRNLAAIRHEDTREWRHKAYSLREMTLADQLTVARAASVVLVVALFQWDFANHLYWATAVFITAGGT